MAWPESQRRSRQHRRRRNQRCEGPVPAGRKELSARAGVAARRGRAVCGKRCGRWRGRVCAWTFASRNDAQAAWSRIDFCWYGVNDGGDASIRSLAVGHGPYDEGVLRETAAQLRQQIDGKPTFGLVFVTPDYAENAADLLEIIRVYGHVPALIGCSSTGLVGRAQEQEEGSGFSLMLVSCRRPGPVDPLHPGRRRGLRRPRFLAPEDGREGRRREGVAGLPQSVFAQCRALA